MRLEEHLAQNTPPQLRQWCRRTEKVNLVLQRMQLDASASPIHSLAREEV